MEKNKLKLLAKKLVVIPVLGLIVACNIIFVSPTQVLAASATPVEWKSKGVLEIKDADGVTQVLIDTNDIKKYIDDKDDEIKARLGGLRFGVVGGKAGYFTTDSDDSFVAF